MTEVFGERMKKAASALGIAAAIALEKYLP
jgi:hypothetical protein